MKFTIVDKALQIQCETSAEVLELIKHYGLDTLAHIDAIASGMLTYTRPSSRRDNGQWFAASHTLGPDWIKPYLARLERLTGFTGDIPEIDAPRYPGGYCVNLCHTHIVELATVSSAGYSARGFIESQDWNGKTAAQRFGPAFAEYVAAGVGDTKREPQYIRLGNNHLKENPNYLRRHAPHPACTSAVLFGALLQWWIDHRATAGQRQILAQCEANHKTVCKSDDLASYLLRSYENGYRVDWGSPLVSFEEFKGA